MEYSIKPKRLGERGIIHYPQKRIVGLYVIDEKTMTKEIDLIEDIEKKYNILEYDICGTKRVDYENTILKEYVKKDIEDAMRVSSKFSIDYHLFDFNDDGMEDYLVCFDGIVWSEEAGDLVRIYIQEENGNLRRVFNRNLHIHENEIDGHASLVILEQKTNGYYDIVVPNSTQIMRYNRKKGEYVF
ncbi:MAG: hypothetical protein IJN54_06245 [Lachnospiraceae bacterium]|nr:hypothetical protein [Lachnospiraceae bacterium]